jgi:uncharacterized protein YndB with AHSA1/START domain
MHGEFELVRHFAAPIGEVWAAYADGELRHRWHRVPGRDSRLVLDFRTDGSEVLTGSFAASGYLEAIDSRLRFLDISRHEQILATHVFTLDGVRRWVSLVTVTFEPVADGTRVRHREQYAFLVWSGDGAHDRAHLRGSVNLSFNALDAVLDDPGQGPGALRQER